jgi:hypothetical protein
MRLLVPLVATTALGSCAIAPAEPDDLCAELAHFANAPGTSASNEVSFTTDWAVRPDPDDPEKLVFGTKACDHAGYDAGRKLCGYLIENASTEFANLNYKRALRCLGASIKLDTSDGGDLPDQMTSRKVLGVRLSRELTVSFSWGSETDLPRMTISATRVHGPA